MLKIAETIPVRTRLPAAAWVIAGVVALSSLVMTEAHAVHDLVAPCRAVQASAPASQVWASVW